MSLSKTFFLIALSPLVYAMSTPYGVVDSKIIIHVLLIGFFLIIIQL